MAGGFRSLAGHWLGGISAKLPDTNGGFRSMLHHWMGGVSAPEAFPSNGGFVSMLHFWMGGVSAQFAPPPDVPVFRGGFDEHAYKKYRKYLKQLNSIKDIKEISKQEYQIIEDIILEINEAESGESWSAPYQDEINPEPYLDYFISEIEYARSLLEKKLKYIENKIMVARLEAIQREKMRREEEELALVLLISL
jgi:hypothetical protein